MPRTRKRLASQTRNFCSQNYRRDARQASLAGPNLTLNRSAAADGLPESTVSRQNVASYRSMIPRAGHLVEYVSQQD